MEKKVWTFNKTLHFFSDIELFLFTFSSTLYKVLRDVLALNNL